jgi:hypothetical protein
VQSEGSDIVFRNFSALSFVNRNSASILNSLTDSRKACHCSRAKIDNYTGKISGPLLEPEAKELLKMAMTELGLSARVYDKILKVSRTIAYLAQSEATQAEHVFRNSTIQEFG